jgi:putative MATE family efflux protein
LRSAAIRAISGAEPAAGRNGRQSGPVDMSADAAPKEKARYTTGSTMRHVLVLASTSSIGLVAIFLVDFLNLFYISLLRDPSLTAAIGYASALVYFYVSVSVGIMIAATALVSRALGADDRPHARVVAGSALAWLTLVIGGATLVSLPFVRPILGLLGATGDTLDTAALFTFIVLPTTPLLGLGMCATGLLRAVGDAKRAMYTTLWFGGIILVLDPLLILALGLGVPGAAIATAVARIGMVAYGIATLIRHHDLIARPTLAAMRRDFAPLARIGVPAILTNIATPVGNGYMTAAMAAYGDAAVAGWTIISRLVPVAFGGLFALSGAVGPVVGQNFGAGLFDRVRGALNDSLKISTIYVVVVSAILLVAQHGIIAAFGAEGEAAELVLLFCRWLAITFIFAGGLYVANAAFNNLNYAALSTVLNWGRATVGTVPFVIAGAWLAGSAGALAGFFIGGIPFGIVATILAYRIVSRLGREPALPAPPAAAKAEAAAKA